MRSEHWKDEKSYFDAVAEEHRDHIGIVDRKKLSRYQGVLRRRFAREMRFALHGDLRGKRVIDVGCGEGQDTVLLAMLGAEQVTGIDISPKAIELAQRTAEVNGVADRVSFACAPVETADLPADGFDVVWCSAILHHLTDNLDLVMKNLAKWARPEALLSFAEPTNLSPTLRRIRKLIPLASGGATPDERPLEQRDLEIMRRWVPDLELRHYGLLGRIDQFVLERFNYERSSWPRRAVVNATGIIDYALLSVPGFDRLGSVSVMWGHPRKVVADAAVKEERSAPQVRVISGG